jgi:putative nucleotidyltransferase with HDIG domain
MADSEVRISIKGLRPGMYVTRLDRPWLETPHAVQGFVLASEEDVERVGRYSHYVYIDTNRGQAPDPHYILHDTRAHAAKPLKQSLPTMGSVDYQDTSTLTEELGKAREATQELERVTGEIIQDLQEGKQLDLDNLKDSLALMIDSIVRNPEALAWLAKLKSTDSYTYHHSLGASIWAATFARHLGLPREEIEQLALGGLLLDIGKTQLPEELLQATERLSPAQMVQIQKHVDYGMELLESASGVDPKILSMVATHHERFDGSGYPQGLKGEEIPLFGRIAAIVDTYDAVTSIRPYANAMSPHGAVGMLYEWRGIEFQPELVEQFIQAMGIYPTGTLVELTTGQVGVITSLSGSSRLRPRVMLILDADKQPRREFREVDLMHEKKSDDGKRLDIKRGLAPGAYGIDPKELFL